MSAPMTVTVDYVDDHDLDERETSPIARIEIADPPDAVHTRLVCDRGGIQIWATPHDDEETLT